MKFHSEWSSMKHTDNDRQETLVYFHAMMKHRHDRRKFAVNFCDVIPYLGTCPWSAYREHYYV